MELEAQSAVRRQTFGSHCFSMSKVAWVGLKVCVNGECTTRVLRTCMLLVGPFWDGIK